MFKPDLLYSSYFQKIMARGTGGIKDTTQNDNVIYKQPLTLSLTLICDNFKCNNSVSVTFSGHGRTFDKVPLYGLFMTRFDV